MGEATPGCVDGAAGTGSGAIVAVEVGVADELPGVIVPEAAPLSAGPGDVAGAVSVTTGSGASLRPQAAAITKRAAKSVRFSSIGRSSSGAVSSMKPAGYAPVTGDT